MVYVRRVSLFLPKRYQLSTGQRGLLNFHPTCLKQSSGSQHSVLAGMMSVEPNKKLNLQAHTDVIVYINKGPSAKKGEIGSRVS